MLKKEVCLLSAHNPTARWQVLAKSKPWQDSDLLEVAG